MFNSVSRSTKVDLRSTIDAIAQKGNTQIPSTTTMTERWDRALAKLYSKIVDVYLIEFLIREQVKVRYREEIDFVPSLGPVRYRVLTLRIGETDVVLAPYIGVHDDGCDAVVQMHIGGSDAHTDMVCDLGRSEPAWSIGQRGTGFRRLFRRFMPARHDELTEQRFKAALNDILLASQPILGDTGKLLDNLSEVVDRVLSGDDLRVAAATIGKKLNEHIAVQARSGAAVRANAPRTPSDVVARIRRTPPLPQALARFKVRAAPHAGGRLAREEPSLMPSNIGSPSD